MKKILYIGGFEMPDKNAAAQRVLSIAKALRQADYEVKFYGMTQDGDFSGNVDGFQYEAYPYPTTTKKWVKYAIGKDIIPYLKKEKPDFVFTYNYPSIAQDKVIGYCRKNNIKVIGDITEWYRAKSFVKKVDTVLRMRYSNKRLDGIIAISKYLSDYYKNQYQVLLPPFVDKSEAKWSTEVAQPTDNKIHLVYIGTGSIKDRLDKIVTGIKSVDKDRFQLEIIGINKEQFYKIYGTNIEIPETSVNFHGRLSHIEALNHLKRSDFQIFFRDNVRVNNAGFPTKFVESMSAGIPVVTNRISNIADYLIHGENGFMIEEPTEELIHKVLMEVSMLDRERIQSIKSSIQLNQFDYHNYVEIIKDFMSRL